MNTGRLRRYALRMPHSPAATKFSPQDWAFALGIVLIWGMNFVVMKVALADFTAFELGAARYVAAALPLVLLIKPPKLHWKFVVLYGLCQGVGQFGFLFSALNAGMTAALASVLMQTQVFFTALFGMLFLRERLGKQQLLGLGLAALALSCFAMHFIAKNNHLTVTLTVFSFILNLLAAASWAVSNIVARRAQQSAVATHGQGYDPLAFVVWSSLLPVLPFLLMSWALEPAALRGRWVHAQWQAWLAVLYLGWVATIAAYGMWTLLLKRHAANRVAPLSLGVPVVGLAAGIGLLGEQVSPWQWAGVACIVAALGCTLLGERWLARKV